MTTLYVVVPCYNEEEVLPETSKRLAAKLTALETQGRISLGMTAAVTGPGSSSPACTSRIRASAGSSSPGTAGTRTPFWPD